MVLSKWTITYLKNRDILQKKISAIEEKEDHILVTNKDETHVIVIVKEKLSSLQQVLNRFKELEEKYKANKLTLVLYNTKNNLDHIIENWDNLIKFQTLAVIFANPDINEKWIISPYVHNKIADTASLKQGLFSLFENVEAYYC